MISKPTRFSIAVYLRDLRSLLFSFSFPIRTWKQTLGLSICGLSRPWTNQKQEYEHLWNFNSIVIVNDHKERVGSFKTERWGRWYRDSRQKVAKVVSLIKWQQIKYSLPLGGTDILLLMRHVYKFMECTSWKIPLIIGKNGVIIKKYNIDYLPWLGTLRWRKWRQDE